MGSSRVCAVCRQAILSAAVIHVCLVGSLEHSEPTPPSPTVWLLSRPWPRIVAVEPDESAPRSEGDFAVMQVRYVVQATASATFAAGPIGGVSFVTASDSDGSRVFLITGSTAKG